MDPQALIQLNGMVDRVDAQAIEGWITVKDISANVPLDVLLDGERIGHCVADLYRKDLDDAGIAGGKCAFKFPMPTFVPASRLKDIKLRISGSIVYLDMPQPRPTDGRVEILSTRFASGWTEMQNGRPAHVCAYLHNEIIGVGVADKTRDDLTDAAEDIGLKYRSFLILFDKSIEPEQVHRITVHEAGSHRAIRNGGNLVVDRHPVFQLFILGSPRSGTSALGDAIATNLGVAWFGECHAAPLFSNAADALSGDLFHLNDFPQFMAKQNFRKYAMDLTKFAYYSLHQSASFIDKTPGSAMISCAPFIQEVFPTAKFIYIQRNGISNVLSRLEKFGGDFREHCEDWVAAVNSWIEVRPKLQNVLELRQEEMLESPRSVAEKLSTYLESADKIADFTESLKLGSLERTGAGIDIDTLENTNWTTEQKSEFVRICGPTMTELGWV